MAEPVLIVGAGPTGLTAALELTRMGVAVRLIEKAAGPATTSRAIGVQARTLEMLQQRGLADRLIARGVITRHANFYGEGKALFRLDFSHVQSRFPYMLFVSEVETEAMLRDAIAEQGVAIEWDTEMIALAQQSPTEADALPRVVLRRSNGALEEARPSWIISAEGAHSVVRQTLDLPFEGTTLAKRFALGDIHVDGALSPDELYIFSSDRGFLGMFPLDRGRFRLIASDLRVIPRARHLHSRSCKRCSTTARTWREHSVISSGALGSGSTAEWCRDCALGGYCSKAMQRTYTRQPGRRG